MLFEVVMSCLEGEGLVGDVLKGFGDLNSIVNLPRANKMLGIANVRGGKLERMTTRGLEKVWEVLRTKPADAAKADTNLR